MQAGFSDGRGYRVAGAGMGHSSHLCPGTKNGKHGGGGAVQVSKERKGTFQQERGSEGQGKQLQLIFPSLPSNREGVEAGWEHG